MHFIRTILILTVLVTIASTVSGRRHHEKHGKKHHQSSKSKGHHKGHHKTHSVEEPEVELDVEPEEVAAAAETPETEDNHEAIDNAIDNALEAKDILKDQEELSSSEAVEHGETLIENIIEAMDVAKGQPQAEVVQPLIIRGQVEDTYKSMSMYLDEARKHHVHLAEAGKQMSPEEVVEHHKQLQQNLELALKMAELHGIAIQQDKAVAAGASPAEIAQIAAIAQGNFN